MDECRFYTIKTKPIRPVDGLTRRSAENAIARFIDGLYHPVRRHSSLDYPSPIAFERKAREVS